MSVDGNPFTPEELVAMVLNHARDITKAYGVDGTISDCVLTVPSFFTQHERRALLDAAELADLNVLALIDENTAAGLHYGIDRIEKEPQNIVFYNMGASSLQVSVIQFHSYEKKEKYSKSRTVGSFQVLGKAWDSTLGGLAFDARIVDFMATEFNEQWNKKRNDGQEKDVRNYPRPMAKLRIQANKVKHVLSANNDIPIFIDALYDDTNYQSHLSRSKFEEICGDLLARTSTPIVNALKAANMTLEDINGVELIGGGMRVPKIQESIKESLGGAMELGMHINSDESMALGAAFHGANVSTAFKVRHVGMTDINPFPIQVSLNDLDGDVKDEDGEAWSKVATIFKANGKVGVKKTIAFTHDQEIACSLDYIEDEAIPEGTNQSIEKFNITGIVDFAKEMEEKGLSKPKISLQFELSSSGVVSLVKAEGVVEEKYTVTVEEEVEIEDDEETKEDGDAEVKQEDGDAEVKQDDGDAEEKKEEGKEEKSEEVPKEDASESEKEDTTEKAAEGDEKKAKPEKKKKKKKKTKKISVEKVSCHLYTIHVYLSTWSYMNFPFAIKGEKEVS